MTAHVFNANLDADYPATLSSKIIGGLIRCDGPRRRITTQLDRALRPAEASRVVLAGTVHARLAEVEWFHTEILGYPAPA